MWFSSTIMFKASFFKAQSLKSTTRFNFGSITIFFNKSLAFWRTDIFFSPSLPFGCFGILLPPFFSHFSHVVVYARFTFQANDFLLLI